MWRGSLLILWCAVACTGAGDFATDDDAGPDGGSPVGLNCDDAGPECVDQPDNFAEQCNALVEATCGQTCTESPGCAAATLLRDHEQERCAAALDDTQTFPHCELGPCDALVVKVCGGDPAVSDCEDAPGCAPALELQARTRDPEASQAELVDANDACVQSLEDEDVFAPCP